MNNTSHILTNRLTGAVMLICNLLIIFTMLHHPEGLSEDPYQNILIKWVHGTLIFLLAFNAFGFGVLMECLKSTRRDTKFCMLFYYIGLGSMIVAALISGFVQTPLLHSFSSDTEAFLYLSKYSSILNLSFAKLALVAYGVSGLLLTPIMFLEKGGLRLVGLVGGAVGTILTISTLAGFQLSVFNMTMLSVIFVLWHASIAIFLFKHN